MLQALDLPIVRAVAVPLAFRDLDGMVSTGPLVPAPEIETNDDGTPVLPTDARIGTLFGYSTIFDTWYEVNDWMEGNFLETIDPHAADETIAEDGGDVKVLFNHGRDMSINNKILGVHEDLRADPTGVYYQVPLLDTSYNRDLLPGLRAGGYGSSFMFRVRADQWNNEPAPSERNPKGLPERTIMNYRLFEHGPVTFPANPAATSGARACALTDDYYRSTLAADAYDELVTKIRSTRDSAPGGSEGEPGSREAVPINHGHDNARRLLQRTPIS